MRTSFMTSMLIIKSHIYIALEASKNAHCSVARPWKSIARTHHFPALHNRPGFSPVYVPASCCKMECTKSAWRLLQIINFSHSEPPLVRRIWKAVVFEVR